MIGIDEMIKDARLVEFPSAFIVVAVLEGHYFLSEKRSVSARKVDLSELTGLSLRTVSRCLKYLQAVEYLKYRAVHCIKMGWVIGIVKA